MAEIESLQEAADQVSQEEGRLVWGKVRDHASPAVRPTKYIVHDKWDGMEEGFVGCYAC